MQDPNMISGGSFLVGVAFTLIILCAGAIAYHYMREAVKSETK